MKFTPGLVLTILKLDVGGRTDVGDTAPYFKQ